MTLRSHPAVPCLLAALFGVGVCLQIYGMDFITGASAFWQAPHADQLQALTGWYGYRFDAWRFPLFEVKTLRYPQGANIIFTDSIPLLALLFKPLAPLLPERFHYFGWWMALCFVLQPVAAVCAFWAWGVRSKLALAAAAVFVLSTPAWLVRHNHLALCGHFLVLFAIALYASTQRTKQLRRVAAAWVALVAAATLVHLYLLAMVFALMVAAAAQRAWTHRKEGARVCGGPLVIPMVALLAVLGIALLGGHLRGEAVQDASRGFGTYSMNLLHPFYPQGALQLPGPLPVLDATGRQYEGFNYLGAGGLLLLPLALLVAPRALFAATRKHAFLLATLFLLTMFALSNRVYVGEKAVLKYRVPRIIDKPVELFRSSGRFFWPVGYVLVLGSLALLAREGERRRWIAGVLVIAPLLQWVDAAPSRAFPRDDTHRPEAPLLPPTIWEPLLREHRLLRTFPGFFCGPGENHRLSQEFQLLAARLRVPVTTVFMARQVDDCTAERDLVDNLQPEERELVVYLSPFQLEHTQGSFPDPSACRATPVGFACSRRFFEPGFDRRLLPEPYFAEAVVPTLRLTPVKLGQSILFRAGEPGSGMLYSGWYQPEGDGVWMRGAQGQVRLLLGAEFPRDLPLRLRFRAATFLSPKHPARTLRVYANGDRLAELPLETWQVQQRVVTLPPALAAREQPLRLEFGISPVTSPRADGVSDDSRQLGIRLEELVIDAPAGSRAVP
jgi:hypothetical protein